MITITARNTSLRMEALTFYGVNLIVWCYCLISGGRPTSYYIVDVLLEGFVELLSHPGSYDSLITVTERTELAEK